MTDVSMTTAAPNRHDARRTWLQAKAVTGTDIGLLVLRLGIGIVFLGHGLQKLGWFEGGGYPTSISKQEEFLKMFGYSSTGFLAWVIVLTEIGVGLSLILGLVTPLGAAGAIGIMWQFLAGPQWGAGLFGNTAGAGGYEFTLAFFVGAIALAFAGPGQLSLDHLFGWRLSKVRWGLASLILGVVVGTVVLTVWGVGFGGTPAPPKFG